MKNLLLLIFTIAFISCTTQNKECEKVDVEQSKALIVDYFKAISEKDYDQLTNLATDDFVLFEDGMIWTTDSLIQVIKSMPNAEFVYDFKDFSVESDCNGSFIKYLNQGDITLNDTTRLNKSWTESAYIKKVDSELKLYFLHSSVVK